VSHAELGADPPVVAVVQHTADCPPGRVGEWLATQGCRLEVFGCFTGDGLPTSVEPYDALLVLGGEMGAYDDATHPWLPATRALLAEAVAAGLPTLGICLGMQLLAVACGGRVAPGPEPQLGIRRVEPTEAAAGDPLLGRLPDPAYAVHWNNDLVLEPPPGAAVLATSARTVQALRQGEAAWGVQFHPEVDPATLRRWADADVAAGVLAAGPATRRLAEVADRDAEQAVVWRDLTTRFAGLLTRRRTAA
jgi:GMP synthase (glutamine-hydrolysing)